MTLLSRSDFPRRVTRLCATVWILFDCVPHRFIDLWARAVDRVEVAEPLGGDPVEANYMTRFQPQKELLLVSLDG